MATQQVEAELQRRDAADNLVAWKLIADALNSVTGLSDPVIDQGTRDKLDEVKTKLDSLITELEQKVEAADLQTDALTDTQLRASDVGVSDSTAQNRLSSILSELQGTLSVLVSNSTLGVSGDVSVDDGGGSLTVDGPLTDTELRASDVGVAVNNTAAVSGDVSVNNHPSDFPDADAHTKLDSLLTELQQKVEAADLQTDALTDTELRAADVGVVVNNTAAVSGEVDVGNHPSDFPDSGAHTRLDTLATEVTLEVVKNLSDAISGHTEAIQNNTDQVETLLTTLRDNQYRRGTDPIQLDPDQSNYTSNKISQKIGDGKFFLFSSSINVASGSEATWSITNPSGNTKVIYLVYVSARNDATDSVFFDIYKDSTITGGTTRTPWDPNFSTGSTATATVEDGSEIRSGGTQLEASVQVTRDAPFNFEGLLVIPPGLSLQLTGVVPGALSSQDLTVGARWYEE